MAEKKRLRRSLLPAAERLENVKIADTGQISRSIRWQKLEARGLQTQPYGKNAASVAGQQTASVMTVEKSRKKRVYRPCYDTAVAEMPDC